MNTRLIQLEAEFDTAAAAQRIAYARFDRSRSRKNAIALDSAKFAFDAALEALEECQAENERDERRKAAAALRADRAERRANADAAQISFAF